MFILVFVYVTGMEVVYGCGKRVDMFGNCKGGNDIVIIQFFKMLKPK